MGKTALSGLPRVVLDTTCIVSALLFSRGRLAWLRRAWQSGRFVPLVSRDQDILTLRETLTATVMEPVRFQAWLESR